MLPPQHLYESLPSQKVSVPHPVDDPLLFPLKIGCSGIAAGEGKFLDRGEVGQTDPGLRTAHAPIQETYCGEGVWFLWRP